MAKRIPHPAATATHITAIIKASEDMAPKPDMPEAAPYLSWTALAFSIASPASQDHAHQKNGRTGKSKSCTHIQTPEWNPVIELPKRTKILPHSPCQQARKFASKELCPARQGIGPDIQFRAPKNTPHLVAKLLAVVRRVKIKKPAIKFDHNLTPLRVRCASFRPALSAACARFRPAGCGGLPA
jgi:hypothetical protein